MSNYASDESFESSTITFEVSFTYFLANNSIQVFYSNVIRKLIARLDPIEPYKYRHYTTSN